MDFLIKPLTCATIHGIDMKHTVPQVKSILAFLEARGWKIADKNKAAIYLTPPPVMKFQKPFTFEISANENQEGYCRHIMFTVSSISEMYEIKYQALYDIFCYDFEDVKNVFIPREVLMEAA